MRIPSVERRSDPRLGLARRVGLVLTATGIASVAVDRRALSGTGADVALAPAFGGFVLLLLLATLVRPPRQAPWIAFALAAGVYVAAAFALGGSPLGMAAYWLAAGLATWRTASHLRPFTVAAFALWTPAIELFASDGAILPPFVRLASMATLVYAVAVLVDPARVHPSDRLRRVGYALLAIATSAAVFERHLMVGSSVLAPDDLFVVVVAVALPLLARAPGRRSTRDATATGLVLAAFALIGIVLLIGTPYHADAVAAPHRAAELLIRGEDPYRSFDLPGAVARFGLDPQLTTHLESGDVVHTYNYPALSFLLVAPFVALGLGDIRWVYLVELLVLILLVLPRLKPAWRPMAVAAVVGSAVVMRQHVLAGIDPTWVLLVVGAHYAIRRGWLSAILLGLAFASRQTSWFVAPFYAVFVWRRSGAREAVRRLGVAAAVGLAVNLPFLVDAPGGVIGGITTPFLAPLEADGVGLVRVAIAGLAPLSRALWGALAFGVFAALLVIFARRPHAVTSAPLVWPFLPLYFAWRSLQNYFAFGPLFAFVGDDELRPETGPTIVDRG